MPYSLSIYRLHLHRTASLQGTASTPKGEAGPPISNMHARQWCYTTYFKVLCHSKCFHKTFLWPSVHCLLIFHLKGWAIRYTPPFLDVMSARRLITHACFNRGVFRRLFVCEQMSTRPGRVGRLSHGCIGLRFLPVNLLSRQLLHWEFRKARRVKSPVNEQLKTTLHFFSAKTRSLLGYAQVFRMRLPKRRRHAAVEDDASEISAQFRNPFVHELKFTLLQKIKVSKPRVLLNVLNMHIICCALLTLVVYFARAWHQLCSPRKTEKLVKIARAIDCRTNVV